MAGVSFGEQYGDCAGAVTDCGTPVDHSHVLFALDCTKCQSHNFTVTDRPAIIQAYDLSANALATLHMVTGSSNTERLAPVLGKNGLKGQLSTARNRMVVCVPGVYALKWEDCTSRGYIEVKFATKDYEVECTEGVHAPAQLHSVSREMVVTPTGLDDQTFIVQLDYRRLSQASLDDLALMLDSRDDINVEGILQQRIAAGGLVGSVGHIAPITDTGTVGHPIIGVDLAALDSRTTNILNQSITNGGLVGSVGHIAPITDTGTAGQPVIGIDLVALDSRTTNLLNQTITNGGLIGSVGHTAPITDTGTVGQPVIGLDIPALVSPAAGNALSVGPDGKLFLSATGGSVTGTAPIIVTGSDVSIDLAALDSRTTNLLNQSITNGGLVGAVDHTAPITDTGTPGNPNIGLSIPALVSTDAGNTLVVGTDGKLRVAPTSSTDGSRVWFQHNGAYTEVDSGYVPSAAVVPLGGATHVLGAPVTLPAGFAGNVTMSVEVFTAGGPFALQLALQASVDSGTTWRTVAYADSNPGATRSFVTGSAVSVSKAFGARINTGLASGNSTGIPGWYVESSVILFNSAFTLAGARNKGDGPGYHLTQNYDISTAFFDVGGLGPVWLRCTVGGGSAGSTYVANGPVKFQYA
jgi:hypothetical protein